MSENKAKAVDGDLDVIVKIGELAQLRARVAELERDLSFALAACRKLTTTRDELFETRKRLEAQEKPLRAVADAALKYRHPSGLGPMKTLADRLDGALRALDAAPEVAE